VKKTILLVGSLAIMTGVYLASRLWAQDTRTTSTQRIAFVNLARVYQGYQKFKIFQAEVKTIKETYQPKLDQLQKNIIKWKAELQDPKMQDKINREAWEEAIKKAQREGEDLVLKLRKEMGKKDEEQMLQLYREIDEAIKSVARPRGYSAVLSYADVAPQTGLDIMAVKSKLETVSMGGISPVYFDPAFDLTATVIDTLNSRYSSGGGNQSVIPASNKQPGR
jgi:Skp family chaperone for outer membrane proteins